LEIINEVAQPSTELLNSEEFCKNIFFAFMSLFCFKFNAHLMDNSWNFGFQVILTAAAVVGFTFRRILGIYLQPPSQPAPPGPISGGARVIPFSETISETTPSLFNDESENVAFPSAPPSYEDAIKSGNGELELPPPYAPSAPPPPDPRSTSV
jgi:hypothetical protein